MLKLRIEEEEQGQLRRSVDVRVRDEAEKTRRTTVSRTSSKQSMNGPALASALSPTGSISDRSSTLFDSSSLLFDPEPTHVPKPSHKHSIIQKQRSGTDQYKVAEYINGTESRTAIEHHKSVEQYKGAEPRSPQRPSEAAYGRDVDMLEQSLEHGNQGALRKTGSSTKVQPRGANDGHRPSKSTDRLPIAQPSHASQVDDLNEQSREALQSRGSSRPPTADQWASVPRGGSEQSDGGRIGSASLARQSKQSVIQNYPPAAPEPFLCVNNCVVATVISPMPCSLKKPTPLWKAEELPPQHVHSHEHVHVSEL